MRLKELPTPDLDQIKQGEQGARDQHGMPVHFVARRTAFTEDALALR
jgi:hypothetical protein